MAEFSPVHPGELLLEEFMKPLGLSHQELADGLCIPSQTTELMTEGQQPITVELALRLAAFFGTTPRFWLNLQQQYALAMAEDEGLVARVAKEVKTYKNHAKN